VAECVWVCDEDGEFFGSCEGRIDEVSLQHEALASQEDADNGRVFAALGFVYSAGVCVLEVFEVL